MGVPPFLELLVAEKQKKVPEDERLSRRSNANADHVCACALYY
jgi:hypothetical protein